MSLKRSKCEFAVQRTEWLGFEIDTQGIRIAKSRVAELTQSPRPCNAKEVAVVLGQAGICARFLAGPRGDRDPAARGDAKGRDVHLGRAQQEAFDKLRELVESAGILVHPRKGVPYTITLRCEPAWMWRTG